MCLIHRLPVVSLILISFVCRFSFKAPTATQPYLRAGPLPRKSTYMHTHRHTQKAIVKAAALCTASLIVFSG
jgi:hypothetical protein